MCKNRLTFSSQVKVQGLVGITVDAGEIFLVHFDERLRDSQRAGSVGGMKRPHHHTHSTERKNPGAALDTGKTADESLATSSMFCVGTVIKQEALDVLGCGDGTSLTAVGPLPPERLFGESGESDDDEEVADTHRSQSTHACNKPNVGSDPTLKRLRPETLNSDSGSSHFQTPASQFINGFSTTPKDMHKDVTGARAAQTREHGSMNECMTHPSELAGIQHGTVDAEMYLNGATSVEITPHAQVRNTAQLRGQNYRTILEHQAYMLIPSCCIFIDLLPFILHIFPCFKYLCGAHWSWVTNITTEYVQSADPSKICIYIYLCKLLKNMLEFKHFPSCAWDVYSYLTLRSLLPRVSNEVNIQHIICP